MDTMWLVVKWGGVALVVLLAFVWFVVPILKKWKPTWFGTATTAAADTVTAWVDQIAFLTALAPAYLLAKKRGDTVILDFLSKCRIESATWDDAPETPALTSSAPTPTVTLERLAFEVAALKTAVAAQTTSTIPPGAVNGA